MKDYFDANWREMLAGFADGMRWGLLAAILLLIVFAVAELAEHSQATLAIVRDLRGEFRTAVGTKEATEE